MKNLVSSQIFSILEIFKTSTTFINLIHSLSARDLLMFLHLQSFKKGEIKKDTSVALKDLHIPLRTDGNQDSLTLKFCANSYPHHRAMREVWREKMSTEDKQNEVPCKRKVNQDFSTSFGLHISVITADDPPKILFFKRENTGKRSIKVLRYPSQ